MTKIRPDTFELGLGLVSLGRVWGVAQSAPPTEAEASDLLKTAFDLGIRIFDTAPAYAASEGRFGRFLADLAPTDREDIVIMTKAGEHWDDESHASFVDHGKDALRRSIDRSLEKLGRIDVLQIHKATRDVVDHPHVIAAVEHAKACGVGTFGASVSDVAAGIAALETGLYQALQFPFNVDTRFMADLIPALHAKGATAIVNRPFAMGGLAAGDPRAAFRFIEDEIGSGIVLTGTGKTKHLRENVESFRTRGR
ncbi:aldo/keto reductase [Microvirga sp. 2MCAF38]|uniref:aldo/keto reductase n=1 Tax=Microvirga sp. 2MCAF38 TaxID=3232989 RepID=UPI003F9E2EEE